MSAKDCFICRNSLPGSSWSLDSLKLIREVFKLCPKHTEKVDQELSKSDTVQHANDREPGEDG